MRRISLRKIGKTSLASASLAAVSIGSSGAAHAHKVTDRYGHWNPPEAAQTHPTVTPFCGGKYDDMARNLNRQDIVSRVNLYRAKAGLPQLQTPKLKQGFINRGYYTKADTRVRDALLLLERRQTHLSENAIADYLKALDIATPSGPVLDWWLTEDISQPKEEVYNCRYWIMAPKEDVCEKAPNAKRIRQSAGFDWLMSEHQLRRADASWRYFGQRHDETQNIFAHIDRQATIRPGLNIWMAQYQFHKALNHELPADIAARAEAGVIDVMTCQASPAEYGILAKGDLGLPFDYLPRYLAENRTQRDIRTLTLSAMTEGNGLDTAYHGALNQLTEQLMNKGWAAGLRILSAPDLSAALTFGKDAVQHDHLYFALPAAQIPGKYPGLQLAHAFTEGDINLGLQVATSVRETALAKLKTEVDQARERLKQNEGTAYKPYINNLRQNLARKEAIHNSYKVNSVLDGDLSDLVKLALTALQAKASHNLEPHHRDIHQEQTDAAFLDDYLRTLLFPGTHQHHWSWRGYAQSVSRFGMQQKGKDSIAFNLPSLRKNDGTPEHGFAAFVDWDKLAIMGDEKRLTRTIALTIFDWVDNAAPQERSRHAALMSQALYDIIRMCRHEDAGKIGGAPVQKRAFERLHRYYGKTTAAKSTKYWWPSRPRHGRFRH